MDSDDNISSNMQLVRLDDCFEALSQFLPTSGDAASSSSAGGMFGFKEKAAMNKQNTLQLATRMFKQINVFHNSAARGSSSSTSLATGQNSLGNFRPKSDESHLENLGGFFIVISEEGAVLFVSENVNAFTPCAQSDLIGSPLSDFAVSQDHRKIRHHLSRKKSGIPVKGLSNVTYPTIGERQFFHFRFKMDTDFNHVNLMGHYRQMGTSSGCPASQREYIFLGMIRPVKDRPITELSLIESIQDQYITRHLPDGKIMFADHRISTACGYLPSDIVGKSGFYFMHGDDLPWSAMANRQMFASSTGEGHSIYRLLCKDNNYIIVQTRGYLEFNQHTQKVESFMCINTVVKEAEGLRLLEEQKERFTPYILQYQQMMLEESRGKQMLQLMSDTTEADKAGKAVSRGGGGRRKRLAAAATATSEDDAVSTTSMSSKSRRLEDDDENHYHHPRELQYRVVDGHRVVDLYPDQMLHAGSNGNGQYGLSQVAVEERDGEYSSASKKSFEDFLALLHEQPVRPPPTSTSTSSSPSPSSSSSTSCRKKCSKAT